MRSALAVSYLSGVPALLFTPSFNCDHLPEIFRELRLNERRDQYPAFRVEVLERPAKRKLPIR
jgi:hypothetical protein